MRIPMQAARTAKIPARQAAKLMQRSKAKPEAKRRPKQGLPQTTKLKAPAAPKQAVATAEGGEEEAEEEAQGRTCIPRQWGQASNNPANGIMQKARQQSFRPHHGQIWTPLIWKQKCVSECRCCRAAHGIFEAESGWRTIGL